MRALVFSDTHLRLDGAIQVIQTMPKVDIVFHLGDMERDARELARRFSGLTFVSVPGNNDYASSNPVQQLVDFDGHSLFLTHGHLLGVKQSLGRLVEAARSYGAEMALFGHTHQPLMRFEGGICLLNPGSAGAVYGGSYGVIETDGKALRADVVLMQTPPAAL